MNPTAPVTRIYKKRARLKFALNFIGGMLTCILVVILNHLIFGHTPASRNTAISVFLLLIFSVAVVMPVVFRYGARLKRRVFEESYVDESAFSASWSSGSLSERESSSAATRKYHLLQLGVAGLVGYFVAALVVLAAYFMSRP